MANDFSRKLFSWYNNNKRILPWLGLKDPYKVWLSEIILQQTRVEQGISYYIKFLKKYPAIQFFAKAPEDEIMKMWEGLGYYSRAGNMITTAKTIVEKHNGIFPDSYESLIQLKGIGNYTANAILSYAFDKPFAVIDANVMRIFSRIYGIKEPVDSLAGKKTIELLAGKLLDKKKPGEFNQAMMDFGSLICKPKNPKCENCPFNNSCIAYKTNSIELYPLKNKKVIKQKRYFNYLVLISGNKIMIEKRTGKDIWKNLYQFPLIESDKIYTLDQLKNNSVYKNMIIHSVTKTTISEIYAQQLTHRSIKSRFFIIECNNLKDVHIPEAAFIHLKDLKNYSFPGTIRNFLKRNSYF